MRKFTLQQILDANKEFLDLVNKNKPDDVDYYDYSLQGENEDTHFIIGYGSYGNRVNWRQSLYETGIIKGSLDFIIKNQLLMLPSEDYQSFNLIQLKRA